MLVMTAAAAGGSGGDDDDGDGDDDLSRRMSISILGVIKIPSAPASDAVGPKRATPPTTQSNFHVFR